MAIGVRCLATLCFSGVAPLKPSVRRRARVGCGFEKCLSRRRWTTKRMKTATKSINVDQLSSALATFGQR
jgi:hypothetical protein